MTGTATSIDIAALGERFAEVDLDRALGALFGLAVGDALGTTNEFKALEAPPFPALATGPLTGIVGGGPFHLEPGQVTDDTQMALALAARLSSGEESLSLDALLADYADWSRVCFDIGYQTRQAISLGTSGAGRRVWDDARGRKPAGNGSLMRTTPIGVFLARADETRRLVSMADSALTHFDPRCQLACVAFNGAVARAASAGSAGHVLVDAAQAELDRGAALLCSTYRDLAAPIEEAREALASDLAAAREGDPDLYGAELHLHDMQGFVRVAFRLAFWELVHAADFASAVIDVANRGGDADTNAAICGALYGAAAGVSAIEPAWLEAVLRAPGIGAGRREYHPEGFMRAIASASRKRDEVADALAPLAALLLK